MGCAYKRGTYGKQEGLLFPIETPAVSFDTVHIDHSDPFARSIRGYSYSFSIVNSFTKIFFEKPTKTLNSREFGVPNRVISEKGQAFTSKSFKGFCGQNKTRTFSTLLYLPAQVVKPNSIREHY